MTLPVRSGPPASVSDLIQAQDRDQALEQELSAVRTAATAWRNGLSALLAGIIGFGLIKGRSDISQLRSPWGAFSGGLLLLSLACGAVAALLLLRAAHGVPALTKLKITKPGPTWAHAEAVASLTALRRGVWWFFICVILLVAAVALTWYGPVAGKPQLSVTINKGSACGTVAGVANHILTINTSAGLIPMNLQKVSAIRITTSC